MIAGGSTTREIRASRQLRAAIATAVPIVVVTLEAIEVAVEVTTFCMLPMSLTTRDCTSPPRVRVKNAIDWRWRWPNRSERSRCMTRWPTVVDCQVWTTPITAEASAMPTMPRTSRAQQGDVLLGDRLVDDALDEERLGEPDGRADDDEPDHEGQAGLGRREQAADAAQRDGGAGELGLVGLRGIGVAAGAAAEGVTPCGDRSLRWSGDIDEVTSQ